ncbi:hypothetical protein ACP70R_044770 [Stipagrostis hirtigluma subsp. patula]
MSCQGVNGGREYSEDAIRELVTGVSSQLWRSNALMVANAILVAIMVAVGASGRRYRHAAATRLLFLGASSLYLPIVSYVASSIGKEYCSTSGLDVSCHGRTYVALLLIWTVLVQIVGTNTSAVVASDDYDNGQKLGPSIELLARTIWTSYLVFYYSRRGFLTDTSEALLDVKISYNRLSQFLIVLCLLSLAKIMLKFYAFQKAKKSLALGRNPRLVAGYMEKLQGSQSSGHELILPPLIVMGEEKQEIEEMPYGYTIKQRNNSLVTVDMVWRLATSDALLVSRPWLKDLCLSFALFKLLRRRFSKTHIAESGSAKAFSFVSDVLLSTGNSDRVFSVIVAWCLVVGIVISDHYIKSRHYQIVCFSLSCSFPPKYVLLGEGVIVFGNILFNSLPIYFLIVAVIMVEAWEVVSYLCSSWVKVTLICSYITRTSWQRSPSVQRCLHFVMGLGVEFIRRRSWSDRMGQMSLVPAQWQCGLRRRFLWLCDRRMRHVRVPSEVKAGIVDALRSSNGVLSKGGTAALHRSRVGGGLLWACEGKGASDVILTWHVATAIFDAGHGGDGGGKRAVATHLSRYCVYLMAAAPELLPDDRAWSTKLCEAARGDVERALAGAAVQEGGGGAMAALLGARSEQEVVRRGATLGKQLLELVPDEEAGWALLAGFWSEMVLYVAPSDNLRAHKKAIAGGAELLTLVWALLTHAGILARPSVRTAA